MKFKYLFPYFFLGGEGCPPSPKAEDFLCIVRKGLTKMETNGGIVHGWGGGLPIPQKCCTNK